MPRANRYIVPGHNYHITHRCHDREFLLKFAKDRDTYRTKLYEGSTRFRVSILGYCITNNHVHLIINAEAKEQVSRFMQLVEGDMAQYFNIRKKRRGAFWEGRYHATMIEGGDYLWNCLNYIDLNMVRAGVVKHPREWKWNGYQELAGLRKRYLAMDINRLLEAVGGVEHAAFMANYEKSLENRILAGERSRDPIWTESLAVGSHAFVERVSQTFTNRQRLDFEENKQSEGTWSVREVSAAYS